MSNLLFKATYGAGQALKAAFNFASGNSAMEKRYLERTDDGAAVAAVGAVLAIVGGILTGAILAPVVGPLAIAFAAAAVVTGGFGPAALEASYKSGRHDFRHKQKSLKVGK